MPIMIHELDPIDPMSDGSYRDIRNASPVMIAHRRPLAAPAPTRLPKTLSAHDRALVDHDAVACRGHKRWEED